MVEPIIIYKETEHMLIKVINDALAQGLPAFCLEALMNNLASEVSRNVNAAYENAVKQTAVKMASEEPSNPVKSEGTDEAPCA